MDSGDERGSVGGLGGHREKSDEKRDESDDDRASTCGRKADIATAAAADRTPTARPVEMR